MILCNWPQTLTVRQNLQCCTPTRICNAMLHSGTRHPGLHLIFLVLFFSLSWNILLLSFFPSLIFFSLLLLVLLLFSSLFSFVFFLLVLNLEAKSFIFVSGGFFVTWNHSAFAFMRYVGIVVLWLPLSRHSLFLRAQPFLKLNWFHAFNYRNLSKKWNQQTNKLSHYVHLISFIYDSVLLRLRLKRKWRHDRNPQVSDKSKALKGVAFRRPPRWSLGHSGRRQGSLVFPFVWSVSP